ncbi:MAG: hypothetical protein P8I94_10050 [Emcibacteraceae bacterium]|nr:hypothetical protein [Emcibacteraceae bacterium]
MKTVALFDIADQSFTFYTTEEWDRQISEWRVELVEQGFYQDVKNMDEEEVVESIGGDEYFWDLI